MKIGLSSLFLVNKTFEDLRRAIKKFDVKYWEVVDEDALRLNKERVKILNELKSTSNIQYTVHAPFADANIASFNPAIRRLVLKQLENSLRYANLLEGKLWIFHPGMHTGLTPLHPGADLQISLQSIRYLLKKAGDLGIKIAIENMPGKSPCLSQQVAEFEQFYRELGNEPIGIALDVGHANTVGQVDLFLDSFMKKIVHVHVSDNDGSFDHHLPIGKGTINWKKIVATLTKNRFNGFVMIETLENPLADLKRFRELYSR